jgi:hypothetical protein
MTRKDYILLPNALARAKPLELTPIAIRQHSYCCEEVADALAADNARFDRARFLKACGVQS